MLGVLKENSQTHYQRGFGVDGLLPNQPTPRQNRTVNSITVHLTPASPAEDLPTCLIQTQELQEQTRPVFGVNFDQKNSLKPAEISDKKGTPFSRKYRAC
jgi:hypothetical protein